MQHDYPAPDKEAVERSANATLASWTKLEKTTPKSPRVRQPQVWAMLCQEFYDPRVVCKHIDWPRLDLSKHTLMEVLNLERHAEC